jgi:hypothetical protein
MGRDHHRDSRNLGEVEVDEEETADQTHNPKPRNNNENRGDKSILGFWKRGCECVFDVRITDTQTRTCRNQDPIRVLEKCEQEKKKSTWRLVWNGGRISLLWSILLMELQ